MKNVKTRGVTPSGLEEMMLEYETKSELASSLLALEDLLNKTQSQVKRVIKRLNANW